jgi:hypothetical protein
MRLLLRFALGFALASVLLIWALMLAGAGHGTSAPLFATLPLPVSILDAVGRMGLSGFWLLMFPGNGLLWGLYFAGLPAINSFVVRMFAAVLIGCVHVGAGVWALSWDTGFARMAQSQPALTIGFFVFFWVVLLALGARTWAGPTYRVRNAALS